MNGCDILYRFWNKVGHSKIGPDQFKPGFTEDVPNLCSLCGHLDLLRGLVLAPVLVATVAVAVMIRRHRVCIWLHRVLEHSTCDPEGLSEIEFHRNNLDERLEL